MTTTNTSSLFLFLLPARNKNGRGESESAVRDFASSFSFVRATKQRTRVFSSSASSPFHITQQKQHSSSSVCRKGWSIPVSTQQQFSCFILRSWYRLPGVGQYSKAVTVGEQNQQQQQRLKKKSFLKVKRRRRNIIYLCNFVFREERGIVSRFLVCLHVLFRCWNDVLQ